MANVASLLKSEITRVSRKEIRSETQGLKKAAAGYRSDIAALKRRVLALEQLVKKLARPGKSDPLVTKEAEPEATFRFSPTRLHAHRQRLELSQVQMGKLLGVSTPSIAKWEEGKTRPRKVNMPSIAGLRKLTRRSAAELLQTLEA